MTQLLNRMISLIIKPSFQKRLIVFLPHLLASLIVLYVVDLSLFTLFILVLGIAVSLVYYSKLHIFQSLKKSVLSIKQDSAKNWFISTKNGYHEEAVNLLGSSFVSNRFIILNYAHNNSVNLFPKYSVLITKDSLSTDEFRRLRVHLKTRV